MESQAAKLDIIRQEVAAYARPSLTSETSYFPDSDDATLLCVVDVTEQDERHFADTGLVALIFGNHILIDIDNDMT